MSTRGIVCVQKDNQYKFAMANHYDSYPEGLGVDVLKLVKEHRIGIEQNLHLVEMVSRNEILSKCYILAGSKTNYENMKMFDRSETMEKVLGIMDLQFDSPVDLLEDIANGEKIKIEDGLRFAAESLMCEYGYVINLDDKKLEVYIGFNTIPLSPNERFAELEVRHNKYYQIKKICEFDITNLPTEDEFLNSISKADKAYENTKEEYEAKKTDGYLLEKYVNGELSEKVNKHNAEEINEYVKQELKKTIEEGIVNLLIKHKEKELLVVNKENFSS